jgi:DNA-binding transcriptional MerR regulator/methylmalonyl-CoA mutase cobalamin-binding subunit
VGVVAEKKKAPEGLRHSIKVVARRTGLSPHLIRMWEKRYATVSPQRNDGNRRLYSAEDIERLAVLKAATEMGHSIGSVAHLTDAQLSALMAEEKALGMPFQAASGGAQEPAGLVEKAYAAVLAMDGGGLEAVLDEGSVVLGQVRLLNEVIVPLVERIGAAWRNGGLKVVHEHIASAAIRTFLGQVARPISVHPGAPVLLATTPAGQSHELGAVMVAAAATSHGWRVVYAGASLPAEEIVSAALAHRVAAVALSIVHPEDDPLLAAELRRMRRLLPKTIPVVVGGRASEAYASALEEIGACRADNLMGLEKILGGIRRQRLGQGV